MITADYFANQWKQARGEVKQKWKALTDTDLNRIDGSVDVLVDLVQEKYGYTRQRAEAEVQQFLLELATHLEKKPEGTM